MFTSNYIFDSCHLPVSLSESEQTGSGLVFYPDNLMRAACPGPSCRFFRSTLLSSGRALLLVLRTTAPCRGTTEPLSWNTTASSSAQLKAARYRSLWSQTRRYTREEDELKRSTQSPWSSERALLRSSLTEQKKLRYDKRSDCSSCRQKDEMMQYKNKNSAGGTECSSAGCWDVMTRSLYSASDWA